MAYLLAWFSRNIGIELERGVFDEKVCFVKENWCTWLVKVEVRGARPHDRRALHAAWLIPRVCGSEKSYEESRKQRRGTSVSLQHWWSSFKQFTSLLRPFRRCLQHNDDAPSSLCFYSRHESNTHTRFNCSTAEWKYRSTRKISLFFPLGFVLFTRPGTHRITFDVTTSLYNIDKNSTGTQVAGNFQTDHEQLFSTWGTSVSIAKAPLSGCRR